MTEEIYLQLYGNCFDRWLGGVQGRVGQGMALVTVFGR